MPVIAKPWVNVVEVQRSYGGPEEGGWYYDSSIRVLQSSKCNTEEEIKEEVSRLKKSYKIGWDSREGCQRKIRVTATPDIDQDFPRPQYE